MQHEAGQTTTTNENMANKNETRQKQHSDAITFVVRDEQLEEQQTNTLMLVQLFATNSPRQTSI
jgi:hypothetical protein